MTTVPPIADAPATSAASTAAAAWKDHAAELRTALLIRRTEQRLLGLFAEGKLFGTVHTCIGQEFSAVAVGRALSPIDTVFSNHRGHGHFLATGGTAAACGPPAPQPRAGGHRCHGPIAPRLAAGRAG